MVELLDIDLIYGLEAEKFDNLANDDKYKSFFNIACAVRDRVIDSVNHINENYLNLDTDDKVMSYIMHCCVVYDSIKLIIGEINSINKNNDDVEPITYNFKASDDKNNYQYFSKIYYKYKSILYPNEPKESHKTAPLDDKFFEFFRSLAFAHPFETSRANFLKKGETNYSPYVVNSTTKYKQDYPKFVNILGVTIYSNISPKICHLFLDVKVLIDFINSRYKTFQKVIDWLFDELKRIDDNYKKRKVNTDGTPEKVLKDIVDILKQRNYEGAYNFEKTLDMLTCNTTCDKNNTNVAKYRESIKLTIPDMIEPINNLDYELLDDIIENNIKNAVKKKYNMYQYYYSKVDDVSKMLFAIKGIKGLFADKWVIIDIDTMDMIEIMLLIETATYLEGKSLLEENN